MSDDAIHPALVAALEPVLADLGRTAGVQLRLRAESWSDFPGQVTAMVFTCDGSGAGVRVMVDDELADRVVSIADQVQEVVVEALWAQGQPATWPECPAHPATHPLTAECGDEGAVWICPKSKYRVARIGSLSVP